MIKPDHPFLRENRRNLEWLGTRDLVSRDWIMKLHDLGLEKAQLNHFYQKTVYFILLYLNGEVVLKRCFWRKSFNPTCHIKMNWKPKMNLELSHLVSRIILVYGSHFQVSNRLSLLDDRILQGYIDVGDGCLEMKCVGDNFEMLVTVLALFVTNILYRLR